MLTCKLKNAALQHLVNFTQKQKSRDFKEIISHVIKNKKEQMKKKKQEKLAMMKGEDDAEKAKENAQ